MAADAGLWDVVILGPARPFLDGLSPEGREECEAVIFDRLCRNPRPENNPARRLADYYPFAASAGVIECIIGRWHFRYRILNANTLEVTWIYFAPNTDDYPTPQLPMPRPTD